MDRPDMRPANGLPLPHGYEDDAIYVDALLKYVSSEELLKFLCGGVHILDFFTRSPDLYSWLIDGDWREWFNLHELQDILDFILREDLDKFKSRENKTWTWRDKVLPPESLVSYIADIRDLSLNRDFIPQRNDSTDCSSAGVNTIPRHVAVGMKLKKIHEVNHFARYIQKLTASIAATEHRNITHLVDFGSGQNYLGRTLASKPYSKHVIAVESKHHNIEGAKLMDVHAKIAPKHGIWRNKKLFRAQQEAATRGRSHEYSMQGDAESEEEQSSSPSDEVQSRRETVSTPPARAKLHQALSGSGSVQYVEHRLQNGDLSAVVDEITYKLETSNREAAQEEKENEAAKEDVSLETDIESITRSDQSLMVISIHSCGNLSHHGLRSLILNPSVTAVAIVGCCYNLVTERLTPPSYKLPNLRPQSQLDPQSPPWFSSPLPGDPHGFPMSSHIAKCPKPINLNITARMMAVQAPQNWTHEESDAFFTRHFFRALLQKIFLDRGVVESPSLPESKRNPYDDYVNGLRSNLPAGGGSTQPIVIGSLRKSCYSSFVSYVRGALERIVRDTERGAFFKEKMGQMTDEEIQRYEFEYSPRKKDLSIVWSLMAYSAALVEAVIVVDRWLWLKEQEEVGAAWVETVFDYGKSPRNLVVVGIKK